MGDIGLLKQGWSWLRSRKNTFVGPQEAAACARERFAFFVDRHWPVLYSWCLRLGRFLLLALRQWKDCVVRGFWSLLVFGYTAMFLIMWSAFLSLTSTSCLLYVLLVLGVAGAIVHSLGYTPGLFIVGVFGILVMWIYGNFWATGILFLVGGYVFSLNHARLLIFMATAYSIYLVYIRVGWFGIFLTLNLAFLSNDILNHFLQGYDHSAEGRHSKGRNDEEPVTEDFPGQCSSSESTFETESTTSSTSSCKISSTSSTVNIQMESCSRIVKSDSESLDEMKRIMDSRNHYEALELPRNKIVDLVALKKEYRKKAMLVHPDKNLGNPLASDSFKKLQCAYEVLSDFTKRKDYDEQLQREEAKSVCQRPCDSPTQTGAVYRSEESRRIECTKCGNSHLWICTTRNKASARWCQDCRRYHPAKDGDGWVEFESSTASSTSLKLVPGLYTGELCWYLLTSLNWDGPCTMVHESGTITSGIIKVEIPRAFVCAESKIFDVSEWAVCQFQGMACRPNTHRPSFHVNMVGLDKATQRTNSSRFNWDLDAEMISEDEVEFENWLQQALASGLFSETPKRRKSWSPFKINPKLGMKSWRKSA